MPRSQVFFVSRCIITAMSKREDRLEPDVDHHVFVVTRMAFQNTGSWTMRM